MGIRPSNQATPPTNEPASRANSARWKLVAGVLFVSAIVVGLRLFRDRLSLAYFAERESLFRQYQADRPGLVYGATLGIYVLVTALSLPGAAHRR